MQALVLTKIKFMRRLKIILLLLLMFLVYSKSTVPSGIDEYTKELKVTQFINYLEEKRYQQEFENFINQLGYDESRNDWTCINRIGALGEWQFMTSTLKWLGYGHITTKAFKKDSTIFPPKLQRQVLEELIHTNTIIMNNYINDFDGLEIRGIKITKAGIIAACHLGGARSVKLYLSTNGNLNRRDILGTSIENYLKRYQIFDLQYRGS